MSSFQHASVIDAQDTIFVIGAAIFTSLLTEGTNTIPYNCDRHFMATHIQT